jgi:citrate synthase
MAYRIRQGRPFNAPPNNLDYTSTFLYLLDHLNERDYKPNPVLAKALDVLFLLHADVRSPRLPFCRSTPDDLGFPPQHEMNCSAAATLQVGSSLVDPYSAVAAGCAAL